MWPLGARAQQAERVRCRLQVADDWIAYLEERLGEQRVTETCAEFYDAQLLKERAKAIEEGWVAWFDARQLEREWEAERRALMK